MPVLAPEDCNPYYNGVRITSGWTQQGLRDTAGLERIEVLKGPASILYGRIEPGGFVNLVPKSPLATPYYALQQQFGSFSFYRTTVDATGPVSQDGSLLYRANLAYENKESFRDFVEGERVYVAPTLQWNISERTKVTFYLDYLHSDVSTDVGGPPPLFGGDGVAKLPRDRNLSEPNLRAKMEDVLFGFDWSHAFNDAWTLRHRFYTNFTWDDENLPGANQFLLEDNRTLVRTNYGIRDSEGRTYFTNLDLAGKFKTWDLEHTLLVGGDYFYFQNTFSYPDFDPVPNIDIFNPVYSGNLGLLPTNVVENGDLGDDWYGLYLQDQIKLPYDLHLLAGLRYDNAEAWQDFGVFSNGRSTTDEDAVTPRVGLLWQPAPMVSLYGNYVEGFGHPNFGALSAGGALKPQTSQQWEFGVKSEFFGGRLTATAAYFDITKQNLATPDPNNPRFSLPVGEVRNRGAELDVAGEILPGWNVFGVYSYIDSEITKDNGGNEGHRLANVPRHGGSLWTTYTLQHGLWRGLRFGGGVVARSEREGVEANTFQLPGFAVINALVGYETRLGPSKLTVQLNVDNLLDKEYLETGRPERTHWGTARIFLGSIRLEF